MHGGGDVHISNIMAIATSVNLHCMYLTRFSYSLNAEYIIQENFMSYKCISFANVNLKLILQ